MVMVCCALNVLHVLLPTNVVPLIVRAMAIVTRFDEHDSFLKHFSQPLNVLALQQCHL